MMGNIWAIVLLCAAFVFADNVDLGEYIDKPPSDGLTNYKIYAPKNPEFMTYLIYAYGTRGDVQPMIHLANIIQSSGKGRCILAAHKDDKAWVESNGIQHIPFESDRLILGNLFEQWTNGGISTVKGQIRLDKVLTYMDDTFVAAAKTMKYEKIMEEVDAVIAPNWYLFGSHIAEYLRVPYVEAQFFPNTKTGAFDLYTAEENYNWLHKMFPKMSGKISRFTYGSSDFGIASIGLRQTNRLRRSLNLREISLKHWNNRMHASPILYAFSPLVIPKPKEWSEHVHLVGYWIPENSSQKDWEPTAELEQFVSTTEDQRAIVYVDLSSMMKYKSAQTKLIKSFRKIKDKKFRWLVATGPHDGPLRKFLTEEWDLAKDKDTVYLKDEPIPHTWLLPKVNVFVHHGGAGTSAAAYYAGTPTIVLPQLGDQVQNCAFAKKLGVGLCMSIKDKEVELEKHASAIMATPEIKQRVMKLSEGLNAENPTQATLDALEKEIKYIYTTGNQFPGQYLKAKTRKALGKAVGEN